MCSFAEANTTHVKIAEVSVLSTTLEAATYHTTLELWRTLRLHNE